MIDYQMNKASEQKLTEHLTSCDVDFVPPLSERIEIAEYAKKLHNKATRFEAWSEGRLVGLVAAYCNDIATSQAFITSVSVLAEWTGQGVARRLMDQCLAHLRSLRFRTVNLEVGEDNRPAIALYEKCGFRVVATVSRHLTMTLHLAGEEPHDEPPQLQR